MKKLPSKQINGQEDKDNIDLSKASKAERELFFAQMAIESLAEASNLKKSKSSS